MKILKDRASTGMHARVAEGSWAQTCAGLGAVAWAAIAVMARVGLVPIGAIELIFLFAPLVIVPLGMELGRVMSVTGRTIGIARRAQPIAAVLAIAALWLPPGRTAGAMACAWMLVCFLVAWSGIVDLMLIYRSPKNPALAIPTSRQTGEKWGTPVFNAYPNFTLIAFALAIARIDLAVGGAWLVASRLGMRPLGIQEPIGLLTAVHFHFAGFATALIAAAALRVADGRSGTGLKWVVPFVVVMPIAVAAGFVISPAAKMVAAALFSASLATMAIFVHSSARRAQNSSARVLLQVAAGCVVAGMVLAAAYAVADFRGSDVLPIPQMARTHGVLNAVGFCLCGLLGWLIEFDSIPRREPFTTETTENTGIHRDSRLLSEAFLWPSLS